MAQRIQENMESSLNNIIFPYRFSGAYYETLKIFEFFERHIHRFFVGGSMFGVSNFLFVENKLSISFLKYFCGDEDRQMKNVQ